MASTPTENTSDGNAVLVRRLSARYDNVASGFILFSLVIAFLILLLSFNASQQGLQSFRGALAQRELVRHLSDIRAAVLDADVAVKGYLLSADDTRLGPYAALKESLPKLLADLNGDEAVDPTMVERLPAIQRATEMIAKLHDDLIEAKRVSQAAPSADATALVVRDWDGEVNLLTLIDPWIAERRAVSLRLQADAIVNARRTAYILVILFLFALGVGILTALTLRRSARERHQVMRALADSRHRLHLVLDHAPAMTYLKDGDGRYTFVNQRWQEVSGKAAAEVLGKTEPELFICANAQGRAERDESVLRTGERLVGEEEANIKGDAKTFQVQRFAIRTLDGHIEGLCGMAFDVTEMKERERVLAAAREEADKANASKNEFLSRMSHELRTPMNSILGFSQLLQRASITPEQQQFTDHILRAGKHLLQLINEVLDFTRIESGRLSLSPEAVPIHAAIQMSVNLVRPLAAERGIQLLIDPSLNGDAFVYADAQRLKQVLLNLLMNAVKYNRDKGDVTITFREMDAHWLRVSICDQGPGIPPEFEPRMFTPFDRLGAMAGVEGTGLGLVLSKGLLTAMGGQLGYVNNPEAGATFWFELRRAEPPAEEAEEVEAHREAVATGGEQVVIYIEDNTANFALVERILKDFQGTRFVGAIQGSMGIQLAKEQRPALILLDLNLPDMSGFEVAQRLRGEPLTREIPLCMLTADASEGQRERARAAGIDEFVTKPFDIAQFVAVLRRLLSR